MTLAKYELIDAEKAHHAIARMCVWLQVSRSGYYEWRERLPRPPRNAARCSPSWSPKSSLTRTRPMATGGCTPPCCVVASAARPN
ncbi:hypothetical protein ACFQX6_12560 [Streptosporangium lutulentum]